MEEEKRSWIMFIIAFALLCFTGVAVDRDEDWKIWLLLAGVATLIGIIWCILENILGKKEMARFAKEKLYDQFFGNVVPGKIIENLKDKYKGQKNLFTLYNTRHSYRWTNYFVPPKYTSKEPTDLGGILILNENSNGIKIQIYDPYNNEIVGFNDFNIDLYFVAKTVRDLVKTYKKKKQIVAWVEKTWETYCSK